MSRRVWRRLAAEPDRTGRTRRSEARMPGHAADALLDVLFVIEASRRGEMVARLRLIDFLFDQMSPTGYVYHSSSRGWDIEVEFDESDGAQTSAVTNECAEAMAVRINRRADAAFVGQTLFRAHLLRSVRGQIADFIFGQLVLVRNRFAFAFWAMRFRRTRKR
jgi:hypothetical protein